MLNRDYLRDASIGFKAWFYDQLEVSSAAMKAKIEQAAMVLNTTEQIVKHTWIGDLPRMRQWADERQIEWLSAGQYALENLDYEVTVGIDRDDLRYDKIGLVKPAILNLAEQAAKQPWIALMQAFIDGFTNLCSDGRALFSDSHPSGDNLTTDQFDTAAYKALRIQMMAQADSRSNRLGVYPTHIFCAYDIEPTVQDTFNSEFLAAGASNILYKTVQPIMVPEFPAKMWILADLSKALKPLIWQQVPQDGGLEGGSRGIVEFIAKDDPLKDEQAFMRKKYLYGASITGRAGYGFHQLVAGSAGGGS
jgi:phage major head subunit gpT-like protein